MSDIRVDPLHDYQMVELNRLKERSIAITYAASDSPLLQVRQTLTKFLDGKIQQVAFLHLVVVHQLADYSCYLDAG